MKLSPAIATTAACCLLLLTSSSCSSSSVTDTALRGSLADHEQQSQSSPCNQASTKDQCYDTKDEDTGTSCLWCSCQAIPSECLSPDQAKLVPSGVFECSTPSSSRSKMERITITSDPVAICDVNSKSGYMSIDGSEYDKDGEDKHLFYWQFDKRNAAEGDSTIPFVVWLTGGPGCSSSLALLAENGPCGVNPDGTSTYLNPHSWTEVAHVLWLDQPAGVGYSYGSEEDSNEAMISEDAYYFLLKFMVENPQYASNPLFVVGESYGGHYVPAIAHRIWKGSPLATDSPNRKNSTNGTLKWPTTTHTASESFPRKSMMPCKPSFPSAPP
jgi:carboxypeptidase C (cathepsin A)